MGLETSELTQAKISTPDFALTIMFNKKQFKKRAHNIGTVEEMRQFILNSIEFDGDFKHTMFDIEYCDPLSGEYCSLVNTLEYLTYFSSNKECDAIPVLIRVTAIVSLKQEKANISPNEPNGTFPTSLPQNNNHNTPVINASSEQGSVTNNEHNHATSSYMTEPSSNGSRIEIEIYYSARKKQEIRLLRLTVAEHVSFKELREFLQSMEDLKNFFIHDKLFLYYKGSNGSKTRITDNNQSIFSFVQTIERGDNPPNFLFSVYE